MSVPDNPKFEALLDFLRRTRGFDFSGYKRGSLMRRVDRRMMSVGLTDYVAYLDFLEVHPEEFSELFNTILINVTAFFRDAPAWADLAGSILPQLLAAKDPAEPIRVWSAGCSSGEEPYTLAIVLAEALGFDDFQRRVKIYATDVDEDALLQARQATYAAKDLQPIPEPLREKYFELQGARFVFNPDLRRAIIFGRHDLLQDAPISRLDLLVCRNTLMYFNAETQSHILARLHFALNDDGILFLGKAEMMLTHADLFRPLDLRHRIFSKVSVPTGRDRILALAPVPDVPVVNQIGGHVRLRELSFDAAPVAQLTVDAAGNLAMANQEMRTIFGVTARDLGRPLQDLEVSYRPVELRALLDDAYAHRQAVAVAAAVRHRSGAPDQYFDVRVAPLFGNAGAVLGATATFIDVSDSYSLREQLQASNTSLEAAYEELQSSNEELETTNEELQSTNEELETTNEELQSTNEELETMNEELQSSNEELQTVNDELRERTYDLRRANANLQGILLGLHDCVIVVDRQLKVLIWNPVAEDMWGLRPEETVGRNLMELDFGLPVEQIPLAPVLAGKTDREFTELDAVNRRGKAIHCLVSGRLFAGDEEEFRGVLLIITEVER